MKINEAVIKRMDYLLKDRGWTTNELVRRSGVHQTTIAEIKAGRTRSPGISTIRSIAKGFGMSLAEFFDDDIFDDIDDNSSIK